ncbi:MAG TPA: hypothetical protein VN513_11365 [Gemmatimonadales bacterium]|nr:hypothetical protein [Gemmatimonadales bacterium]
MTDTGKFLGTVALAPVATGLVVTALALIAGRSVGWMLLVAVVFGLLYGLMAGALHSYDLSTHPGVLTLLLDLSWSLPNTIAGFVLGNAIYIFFGTPDREFSDSKNWISYRPRGTSGFGVDVLQTIGTVNLGGEGKHEPVHVLQARILGPVFIPLVIMSYIATGAIQILFTITIGAILKATGSRETAYLCPPAGPDGSAVPGFFGWIYYATPIELWAYSTEH